ncbi:MAG: hypothetical protein CSB06_03450 [Bacteroidia bacterium]|nr:MAG: hypothetical protein CSB06_03450 [Bacteroidia bacterium]
MKLLLKTSFAALLILATCNFGVAQKLKFGHTNSQKIIEELPETKKAKEEITALTEKHKKRFSEMQAEFEKRYKEIVENEQLDPKSPEKWDDLTKQDKQTEIMSLQQRIQSYEQSVSSKIAEKQQELFTPISEKVKKALEDVAKEGNFIYIFDESVLLYFSKTQSEDVTAAIKKKLGLK